MKLVIILCLSILSSMAFAQEKIKSQSKPKPKVTVLVSPDEKEAFLLILNGALFVVNSDDVKLINSSIVDTFFPPSMPGSEKFKKYRPLYKKDTPKISGVLEITTVKGAVIPKKFKINNQKKKVEANSDKHSNSN